MRLKQGFSGYKTVTYTAHGNEPHPDVLTFHDILTKESSRVSTNLFSRLSISPCMGKLFYTLHEPARQHNVDGVLEYTPYVTRTSWGLESIFFRNRSARFMAIIDGEAALTKEQVTSSIVCFLFGIVMTLFAIISLLVWMDAPTSAIVFVTIFYVIFVFNSVRGSIGLGTAYKKIFNDNHEINLTEKSDALYHVQETFRITEPRPELYWTVFCVGVILLVIIPLIALFSAGNNRVGFVFIGMSFFTVVRNVCNAPGKCKDPFPFI